MTRRGRRSGADPDLGEIAATHGSRVARRLSPASAGTPQGRGGAMPGLRWNVFDWCLALSLTALAEAQLAVYGHCCDVGRVGPAGYVLTLLETLPVAWRRRAPLPCLLVGGGAGIAQVVIDSPVTDFSKVGVALLCFTVASQSRQTVAAVLAALTPAGILAAAMLRGRTTTPYDLMVLYVEFAVAWGLGLGARPRQRLAAARVERL